MLYSFNYKYKRYSLKNHPVLILMPNRWGTDNSDFLNSNIMLLLMNCISTFAEIIFRLIPQGWNCETSPSCEETHLQSICLWLLRRWLPWKPTYAKHRLSHKCIHKFTSHLLSVYLPFAISRHFKRNAGTFSTWEVFLYSSLSLKQYSIEHLHKIPDS